MQVGDIVTIKVVDEGADEADIRLNGKMGIIDTIDRDMVLINFVFPYEGLHSGGKDVPRYEHSYWWLYKCDVQVYDARLG